VQLDDIEQELKKVRKKMADFPSKGATAKAVWEYTTRELNADGNNTIRDAVISDGIKIPGDRINKMLVDETPTEGTIASDTTEQILVEKDFTGSPKVCRLEGHVDLTNLAGAEVVTIRQYIQEIAGGAYVKYREESYGVQTEPDLKVETNWTRYKIKVTLQKAGAAKNFDYIFFSKTQA